MTEDIRNGGWRGAVRWPGETGSPNEHILEAYLGIRLQGLDSNRLTLNALIEGAERLL